MVSKPATAFLLATALLVSACGGDDDDDIAGVTTEHCEYRALTATAGAGGTVSAGALQAGAAEAVFDIPVGSALGGYTARVGFLGEAGRVDNRKVAISGAFDASIGVESAPRVKALALSAGGENVVLVKIDSIYPFEGMVFDLEDRLGEDYAGKVLITASHSHSAWGHHSWHSAYYLGSGVPRELAYRRYMDTIEDTVRAAIAAQRAAKLGVHVDMAFDPDDQITRDRRGENNDLMGGPRKDDALFMFRVDGTDGVPIAALPVFGIHGTINDVDNSLASTDAPGAIESFLEEQFDDEVVVMHLQGASGDVSPTPHGGVDCNLPPGDDEEDPCSVFLRAEGNARAAVPVLMQAWTDAGADMQTDIEIEMLTRSVELGPYPETFTIRDGALEYAPFERDRVADGVIWDGDDIVSPIDEFNAPVGAALCENDETMFYVALIPGTENLAPYASCARVDDATEIFEIIVDADWESDATHPICQSTRTNISALRLGDYLIGTLPGEITVPLADLVRARSPVAADHTVLLGHAQGQVGYLLTAEDWLLGGYEASINIWGPLEGEHLAEQLVDLLPLATTSEREDGTDGGVDRFVHPPVTDDLPIDDPAPQAGTVPAEVPSAIWVRSGTPASAQPPATVQRVSGIATFVWIGDDPLTATPVVTLERETSPGSGSFEPVHRRSGRVVRDHALLLEYTPQPVRRDGDNPQTHYWAVEWQAVPWYGALDDSGESLDSLGARAGVPLDIYRFHVQGAEFELTSDPFEVTPANLDVTVARAGTNITATVRINAPKGYRLLDMEVDSNKPVPVREGLFDVELTLSSGGPRNFDDQAIASDGTLSVDAGSDAANVTHVRVTDAYGNTKNVTL